MNKKQQILLALLVAYLGYQGLAIYKAVKKSNAEREQIKRETDLDLEAIEKATVRACELMLQRLHDGWTYQDIMRAYEDDIEFGMLAHRTGMGPA